VRPQTAGKRAPSTPVTICSHFDPAAFESVNLFGLAQTRTDSLLAGAGVRLQWIRRKHTGAGVGSGIIELKFVRVVPAGLASKLDARALAAARPHGQAAIFVLCDRVAAYLQPVRNCDRPAVLGHILAHEIIHVLEGATQHSDSGLMMARWTWRELRDMTVGGLPLAPEDRELIRLGLARIPSMGGSW
jgi:hypothetical protein